MDEPVSGTSTIEWTDKTWNPVAGCDRVSPGCDHCYAEAIAKRFAGSKAFPDGFKVTMHPDRLEDPLHWRKPCRVFVNSMSDLFHPDISVHYIATVWAIMTIAKQHTFQVLTKRPQRMATMVETEGFNALVNDALSMYGAPDISRGLADSFIWLGTSIESDQYTFRANHLRKTPARVRFLSLEPLLGPLPSLDLAGIDWVIVGGESGPGAREMDLNWAEKIVERCVLAGVPVFVKQLGSAWGKRWGDSKGSKISLWPNSLVYRQYPA
jgi:protein gp37